MNKGMGMGGCIVSKNILENKGKLKWCIKENSQNELDNGWRFLSDLDTNEFLSNVSNLVVCDWGTIVDLEPAVIPIFDMPVGTEITLVQENGKKYFVYSENGEVVDFNT